MANKLFLSFLMIFAAVNTTMIPMEGPGEPSRRKNNDQHADKEKKPKTTLNIFEAAECGDTEAIRSLVEDGGDVNVANDNGVRPIHLAAKLGHVDTIGFLIEQGASVNVTDEWGQQPTHWAARFNQYGALDVLIKNGADVHAVANVGEQPIHWAAQCDRTDSLCLLIDQGAHVGATAKNGNQPIDFAALTGQINTIRFLLDHGVSIYLPKQMFLATVNPSRNYEHVIFLVANSASNFTFNWDALDLAEHLAEPVPEMNIHNRLIALTISRVFRMAAGQNKKELLNLIMERYREQLTEDDFIEAMVGAATAGHEKIVDLLYGCMSGDDRLECTIISTLGLVVRRAAAQGRAKFVERLIRRYNSQLEYRNYTQALICAATAGRAVVIERLFKRMPNDLSKLPDEKLSIALSSDISRALERAAAQGHVECVENLISQHIFFTNNSLLSSAGSLIPQLLSQSGHLSPADIVTFERVQRYSRILLTLGARQRWMCFIRPLIRLEPAGRRMHPEPVSEEEAERLVPLHIRSIPEELWQLIMRFFAQTNLYSSEGEETRLELHCILDRLPPEG